MAWACAAAVWLMPFFIYHLSGGLARAYAAPLLALFWLGWLRKKPPASEPGPGAHGPVHPLQSLSWPGLSLGLAHGAGIIGPFLGLKSWEPPYLTKPLHWLVLLAGAALVWYLNHGLAASGFGPWVSGTEALGMPEAGRGRAVAAVPHPTLYVGGDHRGLGLDRPVPGMGLWARPGREPGCPGPGLPGVVPRISGMERKPVPDRPLRKSSSPWSSWSWPR